MNISLVLPAYNEEKNIKSTIDLLLENKEINQIIVINDGSSDKTADICKAYDTITFIDLQQNKGKTNAVLRGIAEAKHDHIFLFDADLLGLKQEYITNTIKKYKDGYDMVIMDYSGAGWFRHRIIQGITALSGVRILHKKYFSEISFLPDDSFELETRINEYFIKHNLSIAIVDAETVVSPYKFQKYPFHVGVIREIQAMEQYMLINGIGGIFSTLGNWRKIYKKRYE